MTKISDLPIARAGPYIRPFAQSVLEDDPREIVQVVKSSVIARNPRPSRGHPKPVLLNPATDGLRYEGWDTGHKEFCEILGVKNPPEHWKKITERQAKYIPADPTPIRWDLPAHGRRSNPNCGKMKGITVCPSGHVVKPRRWYCDSLTCPDCMDHCTVTHANKAVQRIRGARDIFSFYGSSFELHHLVISAPPNTYDDFATVGGANAHFENFARILHGLGIFGAVGVLHLWRLNDHDDNAEELSGVLPELSGVPVWREGPHLHVVGFCNPDLVRASVQRLYASTGWVVKIISDEPLTDNGAEAVISYALTHASIGVPDREGAKALRTLRYFGGLNTSKMVKFHEWTTPVNMTCAECKKEVVDFDDLENNRLSDVEDLPPVLRTLNHSIFVLRSDKPRIDEITEGLTFSDLIRFAERSPRMAVVYDTQTTEIKPNFCRAHDGIEDIPEGWDRPPLRGQLRIINSENWADYSEFLRSSSG